MAHKIAITGGTGFIGAALAGNLLALGHEVAMLIRDETPPHHTRLRKVRGDVRNYDDVERLIYEHQPFVIYHLAAVAPVEYGLIAPRQTIEANVMGTVNVLEVVRNFQADTQIIIISSDKVYGKPLDSPATEITPFNPRHPYDASKAAADLIATSYQAVYPWMNIHVIRPVNVYGPGDVHWNRLVPGCIKTFLESKEFLIRSDGSFVRDYLYIDDCIYALIAFVGAIVDGGIKEGSAWNLSSHQGFKVITVVETIAKIMGRDPKYRILDMAPTETKKLVVDGSKFMNATKWRPIFTFEQGIENAISWYSDYLEHLNIPAGYK